MVSQIAYYPTSPVGNTLSRSGTATAFRNDLVFRALPRARSLHGHAVKRAPHSADPHNQRGWLTAKRKLSAFRGGLDAFDDEPREHS